MLEKIGSNCKNFRVKNGYTRKVVSRETFYSLQNIIKFEKGNNDNLRILMWYIKHGMTIEEVLRGVDDEC